MADGLPSVEVRDDLVRLYAAYIAGVPAEQWRLFGSGSFVLRAIREVWDAATETSAERVERVTRWAAAYRVLMRSGNSNAVHAAGVLRFMDGDIAPELRVEDVEFFLSQAEVLADLRERLVKADAELKALAADSDGPDRIARLQGKSQGVRLALSYLDEVTR